MRRSGRNGSDHGGWHYVRVAHGALVLCHVSMHSDFLTLACRRAIANMVPGIDVFVTGGLGGVHRGCETTMGTLCGVRRWLWVKRAEMVTRLREQMCQQTYRSWGAPRSPWFVLALSPSWTLAKHSRCWKPM